MRKPFTIAILILTIGYSNVGTAQEAPEWANDLLESWYAAYHAKDAERLAEYYSNDARLNDAQGRDAIVASFKAAFSESTDSCPNEGFEGFRVVGPIAAGWGTDTCTISPANGDDSYTRTTRWLAIYERQDDGSWLTIRDYFEVVE